MIDFVGRYSSSTPCVSGNGVYFSRVRSKSLGGNAISGPVFAGLGVRTPNMDEPVSLARDIWRRALDQNTDPRIDWNNRRPILMDVGRFCLRNMHDDKVRTGEAGYRLELLGSIVILGVMDTRYDDLNMYLTKFDDTGLGEVRLSDSNLRPLHPALAPATVQAWGSKLSTFRDEWPIRYALETRDQRPSASPVVIAMRGHEKLIRHADMLREEQQHQQ